MYNAQMKLRVEKVNITVEQELPDGRTYPVIAMTMGKYKREAVEINVHSWSSDVSLYYTDSRCGTNIVLPSCSFSVSADG